MKAAIYGSHRETAGTIRQMKACQAAIDEKLYSNEGVEQGNLHCRGGAQDSAAGRPGTDHDVLRCMAKVSRPMHVLRQGQHLQC